MSVERLTGWKENGRAYVIDCPEFELPEKANKVLQNLADKHAVIEDVLGDTYDLDHLRELVEADKDGRCVVLPCKVGDKVYWIVDGTGLWMVQCLSAPSPLQQQKKLAKPSFSPAQRWMLRADGGGNLNE